MTRPVASTLVGRSAEWAHLADAAELARSGQPTIVLVRGEAGIGKTRLVGDWTRSARADGTIVAVGRCIEVEGAALPLAPVAGVVRDLARQLGTPPVQAAAGERRPVLASLVPELADGNAPARQVTHGQTFDAVAGLVRGLAADGLLVVVLEDVHWSDVLTRDLIAYLARTMTDERLLLVLTTRPEVPDPVAEFLGELVRLPTVERIDLARLDPPQVAALSEQLSSVPLSPARLEALIRLSDGVPFLVEELVAAGVDPTGSESNPAGQLLLRRWSRLGPAARQVVVASSLADAELTDQLLRAAVAEENDRPDAALHEAVEGGVLTPAPDRDGYRFRHALLRRAVADTLLPGEARTWHQRWARALESTPRELDALTLAVALAHHWDGARDAPRALIACLAAADQCRLHSAFVEQSRLLLRAVAWWDEAPDAVELTGLDRGLLVEKVVDLLTAADAIPELIRFAEAELRRTPETDPLQRAFWRILIAEQRADQERLREPPDLADLEDLIELVRTAPASRTQVWSACELSWVLGPNDPERAVAMIELAVASAEELDDEELMLRMRATRAFVPEWLGRGDQELELHLALLPDAHRLDATGYSFFLASMVGVNCDLGRLDAALDAIAYARERLGDELQAPRAWGQITAYEALTKIELGRWDEAQHILEAAHQRYDDEDWPWLALNRAMLAAWRGNLEQAERTWAGIGFDPRASSGTWDYDGWLRVTIACAQQDITTVRLVVAGMLDRRDIRSSTVGLRLLLVAATAEADEAARARALGDRAALVATELAVATLCQVLLRIPWPGAAADAQRLHITAELDRWAGGVDPAPWHAAVDAWAPIGYPHERGWALLHLAEALVESGRRDDAGLALDEAAAIAERLGARPLADEVSAFARRARLHRPKIPQPRTGEDATGDTGNGTLGLTLREKEVLALVCEGLNNPAIAKQLFMSPKTASVHVSRILTKLGATNRTQAATTAHRLGLDRPPS